MEYLIEHLLIADHVGKSVRAQKKRVPAFQFLTVKIRPYVFLGPEGSGNKVFLRMVACLFRRDVAPPDHVFHQ